VVIANCCAVSPIWVFVSPSAGASALHNFIPLSIHTNMERKDAAVGAQNILHSPLMFPHPNTSKFASLSELTPILSQSNNPIQTLYRFTTCNK